MNVICLSRMFRGLAASLLVFAAGVPPTLAQQEYTVGQVPSLLVWSVAFAPDGRTFAAAQDNLVRLYDTATGKLLRTIVSKSKEGAVARFELSAYSPVPDMVMSLDFSPDGKLLAGGRSDATVCLWKTTGTDAPAVLEAHEGQVRCSRFSPDGTLLATGSQDDDVLLWDVTGRKVKTRLRGRGGWVECVALSTNGKLLASGCEDGTVRLWDVARGKEIRTLRTSEGSVKCVAFSPDNRVLLAGDDRNEIHIWDVGTGRNNGTLRGHTSRVSGVCVLRDNRTAISAGLGQTVRAWDLQRREQIGLVRTPWQSTESMAVSPDQKSILCGESWGAIQLIRVDRLLGRLPAESGSPP